MDIAIASEFGDEEREQLPAIPDRPDLMERADDLLAELGRIKVTDDMLYKEVDEYRKEAVNTIDLIKDHVFAPAREYYHERHKAVTTKQKEYTDKFEQVKSAAIKSLRAYDDEQERKRREEAERLRREAEALLRKQREEEAARLEAEGKAEEAAQVEAEPLPVVEAPEVKLESSTRGNHYSTTWKGRVIDFAALPDMFKVVNQSALDAYAKSTKGKQPVAGAEFYEEKSFVGSKK